MPRLSEREIRQFFTTNSKCVQHLSTSPMCAILAHVLPYHLFHEQELLQATPSALHIGKMQLAALEAVLTEDRLRVAIVHDPYFRTAVVQTNLTDAGFLDPRSGAGNLHDWVKKSTLPELREIVKTAQVHAAQHEEVFQQHMTTAPAAIRLRHSQGTLRIGFVLQRRPDWLVRSWVTFNTPY